MLESMTTDPSSFWGENMRGSKQMKSTTAKQLKTVTVLDWDTSGGSLNLRRAHLIVGLVGSHQKASRDAAMAVYAKALGQEPNQLRNWAHDKDQEPFMKKMLFQVECMLNLPLLLLLLVPLLLMMLQPTLLLLQL